MTWSCIVSICLFQEVFQKEYSDREKTQKQPIRKDTRNRKGFTAQLQTFATMRKGTNDIVLMYVVILRVSYILKTIETGDNDNSCEVKGTRTRFAPSPPTGEECM